MERRYGDAYTQRRIEFWQTILALHKIGAVAIPATHLLTDKDIVYRNNAASIKAIVATEDDNLIGHVNLAMPNLLLINTV